MGAALWVHGRNPELLAAQDPAVARHCRIDLIGHRRLRPEGDHPLACAGQGVRIGDARRVRLARGGRPRL